MQCVCDRLQELWENEVKTKGLQCASFGVVVARFTRSVLLLCLLLNILNIIFTFVGPVSFVICDIVVIVDHLVC